MNKTMIIRGVAILCAGVSASIFASNQLLGTSPSETSVDLSHLQTQPSQVMGASLVNSNAQLRFGPTSDAAETIAAPDTDLVEFTIAPPEGSDTTLVAFEAEPVPQTDDEPTGKLQHAVNLADLEPDECSPSLTSAPLVDALIELVLDAPCHPDARIVVSHNDLEFSAYTSAEGTFSAFLPALSVDAKIDVFLSDDLFLQTELEVPDADEHLRIALQWSGDAQFALHAYHDGAAYGDTGHVHALNPFDSNLDEAFLISLGTVRGQDPMIAEIYSLPAHLAGQSRVEVELQFTQEHCGKDLSAFLLNNSAAHSSPLKEMIFEMPECPAEAGMVVMEIDFAQGADEYLQDTPTARLNLLD
jgi:hypothetical protein